MVDTIKELSELSNKLNQETDTLNDTITSLNAKLGKLNLGVEAWVGSITKGDPWYGPDDDEMRDPMHEETWLGYYRFERGWELAVQKLTRHQTDTFDFRGQRQEETVETEDVLPLLNASREIRIGAMKLIPELLDEIRNTAQEFLQSIQKAKQAAAKL